MSRTKLGTARSEVDQVKISADLDALMEALEANGNSRMSPVYRWLDVRYNDLVVRLGSQRVSWEAFAAHLKGLGLTDGKGDAPTPSVTRNTWHRVKTSRGATGSVLSNGSRKVAPVPVVADQHDDKTAHGSDTTQDDSTLGGSGYPPGVLLLAAPVGAEVSFGDSESTDAASPRLNPPSASDDVSPSPPSEEEHRTSGPVSWTATFTSPPPPDIRDLLRRSGGAWKPKPGCWSGASANGLDDLTASVEAAGGSLKVSPGARPMI